MPATDLADCTATELLALYRSRQASPVEATQAALARIARHNDTLRAFVHVAAEEALASAEQSQARWQQGTPRGALDGVPTSIKDLILARGWPTLRGSHTVEAEQAWDVDAPATQRLREAGAVLLGKTATPEFGCKGETSSPRNGVSRNPWDPTKTPGGSSGGTAAAVAAGMGPLSLGTDGAGSVRIPAACAWPGRPRWATHAASTPKWRQLANVRPTAWPNWALRSRPSTPASKTRWRSRPGCGSWPAGRFGIRSRPSSRPEPTPTSPPRRSWDRA